MLIGEPTTQKARKQHTCWWCGEHIAVGESYARWLWKDCGNLDAIKVHCECRAAWSELPPEDNEVYFAEFSRGCTCEHGQCECKEKEEVEA